jgi:hypothetical protein
MCLAAVEVIISVKFPLICLRIKWNGRSGPVDFMRSCRVENSPEGAVRAIRERFGRQTGRRADRKNDYILMATLICATEWPRCKPTLAGLPPADELSWFGRKQMARLAHFYGLLLRYDLPVRRGYWLECLRTIHAKLGRDDSNGTLVSQDLS